MASAPEWLKLPVVAERGARKGIVRSGDWWRRQAKAGHIEYLQPTPRSLWLSRASVDKFIEESRVPAREAAS
jgi:hypothetical protein